MQKNKDNADKTRFYEDGSNLRRIRAKADYQEHAANEHWYLRRIRAKADYQEHAANEH